MKEIKVYLDDILDSIEKIEEYTRGVDFEKFDSNSELQDAVVRRLEIIGEAVKNLPTETKNEHREIPWKQIAGMRDILIHEYAGVSLKRVWKVITENITPLKKTVTEIIKKI